MHYDSKTMDAIFGVLLAKSSPFLMLVTCEVVKEYSLHYGVCKETSTVFASYAMLEVDSAAGHIGQT